MPDGRGLELEVWLEGVGSRRYTLKLCFYLDRLFMVWRQQMRMTRTLYDSGIDAISKYYPGLLLQACMTKIPKEQGKSLEWT